MAVPVVFLLAIVAAQWGARVKPKPEVKVRQIVIKADATKPEDIERARKKIEEAYAKLKQGANFKMVASLHSEADSARTEGDLGWIGKGILPKRLEDIVFSLQPGQYSEIVSDIGPDTHIYRILYAEERRHF